MVAGSDDAIRHFPGDDAGRHRVARVRQRDEIAEGGHAISAAGSRVSARLRTQLRHHVVHHANYGLSPSIRIHPRSSGRKYVNEFN